MIDCLCCSLNLTDPIQTGLATAVATMIKLLYSGQIEGGLQLGRDHERFLSKFRFFDLQISDCDLMLPFFGRPPVSG
jgi:hypothetical protein